MAKDVKTSIIVPVYNVEQYLSKCLDSLIEQTLKDIEIICINDESPDNCTKILEDYATKDSRIIVLNQKNSGLGVARNRGLDVAKGLLCLICLYLCGKLHAAGNRFCRIIKFCLSFFAKYSFSIYFMHIITIHFLYFKQGEIQNFLNARSGLVNHIAIYLTATVICFALGFLAMIIKKICGKYSRMLIGS